MAEMSQLADINGCTITVGTTGTISSLMTKELDSIRYIQEASSSSSKKHQFAPASVPCSSTPRTLKPGRNPPIKAESGSINSHTKKNSGNAIYRSSLDSTKTRQAPLRNGHRTPMLSTENVTMDRSKMKDKSEKKRSYIVEVVDLKCNNPMSSRLKKLGFSKLSESII